MISTLIRLLIGTALLIAVGAAVAAPLLPEDGPVTIGFRSTTTHVALLEVDGQRVAAKIRDRLPIEARSEGLARYRVDVAITDYDKGNSYVRSMVSGLAQVHTDLSLTIYAERDGAVVGHKLLSVTSAPMGVSDSASRIVDIEDVLAQSVSAALLGSGERIALGDR
ncbi:hypothetical protein [uncultured Nevskia sp.]|uniref:hypothetical protein n=1 Tax=uncultured Nevskia sp. TaxID=228950 RepID=UPI0025ECD503|nr:hypothetical protein [uncultured Nevskia sp.]